MSLNITYYIKWKLNKHLLDYFKLIFQINCLQKKIECIETELDKCLKLYKDENLKHIEVQKENEYLNSHIKVSMTYIIGFIIIYLINNLSLYVQNIFKVVEIIMYLLLWADKNRFHYGICWVVVVSALMLVFQIERYTYIFKNELFHEEIIIIILALSEKYVISFLL